MRRPARSSGAPPPALFAAAIPHWLGAALFLLGEEIIFRGLLQRSLEQDLAPSVPGPTRERTSWKTRAAAGALTAALGIVALAMTSGPLTGLMISLQVAATLARGVTGRVSASVLARLTGLAVCTFL